MIPFLFSSGLTAISTYFLTKELWSPGAGLFAACFIAIVPGYISRSVAGSYDNEGIAIFALQFTYYLWVSLLKVCPLSLFFLGLTFFGFIALFSNMSEFFLLVRAQHSALNKHNQTMR